MDYLVNQRTPTITANSASRSHVGTAGLLLMQLSHSLQSSNLLRLWRTGNDRRPDCTCGSGAVSNFTRCVTFGAKNQNFGAQSQYCPRRVAKLTSHARTNPVATA
jgi:hypothetical protein